jgi:hypothetical protein
MKLLAQGLSHGRPKAVVAKPRIGNREDRHFWASTFWG